MAKAPKLKVFRMPVGFHDAYVAAPSQKAAAEAWGADASVFSRGEAELVTDPALTKEPLAAPGKVIKRLRGTAAEQIAALGASEAEATPARPKKPAAKPKPRPSRAALDMAEQALADAEARQGEARQRLQEREVELARERVALEKAQAEERAKLARKRDEQEAKYEDALRKWREDS